MAVAGPEVPGYRPLALVPRHVGRGFPVPELPAHVPADGIGAGPDQAGLDQPAGLGLALPLGLLDEALGEQQGQRPSGAFGEHQGTPTGIIG